MPLGVIDALAVPQALNHRSGEVPAVDGETPFSALRDLTDVAFDGIMICDQGIILQANSSFADMVGFAQRAISGTAISTCIESEDGTALEDLLDAAETRAQVGRIRGAQGSFPIELRVRRFPLVGHTRPIVITARDIREQRASEARIRFLAFHDSLTGLGNRIFLRDRLQGMLAKASSDGDQVAALCIDLDHFKAINDQHGHAAGDQLLREVSWRLLEIIQETDTLARIGGDEFIIVAEVGSAGRAGMEHLANRLVRGLAVPFEVGEHEFSISGSIGMAFYPSDGADADTLLAHADRALLHVKSAGRAGFAAYRVEMDAEQRARRELEKDIRVALAADQFSLAYQPQVRADNGEVVGFEALLRWHHPRRGWVSPADFIPVAERTNAIGPIGDWVMRSACMVAAHWPAKLRIAVNVSPAQLEQPDFADRVAAALVDSGLDPARLELEITETLLVRDPTHALRMLRTLKLLGVGLAMDDFGTGYSSLSALQTFPFDRIKIDRSFVKDLPASENALAIVRAVMGLGRALKLPVVAEGVETAAQFALLREEGCDEIQGYLIGKPAPIDTYFAATHEFKGFEIAP